MSEALSVLVVGATGSIGRLAVDEALARGHRVRALVRSAGRAQVLPSAVEVVLGDLTRPVTLAAAVDGVDGVVFTHGSTGDAESVDYAGVRDVLHALSPRTARIALMTAIGVTDRSGAYNRSTGAHDWKRRLERLVRASGLPYTIVRPGWFDYNDPDELQLVMLQGDHAGDASDGVIARRQVAQVLVDSLTSAAANRKTFELVATRGPAPADLEPLFAVLDADRPGTVDGVRDVENMPVDSEPDHVRTDLDHARP